MTRGFNAALRWRLPLWLRRGPGKRGALGFLLLPLAFLLPVEALGMVGSRAQGISLLVWISSLALSLSVRGASGLRDPQGIWTYQKGCGMGETSLEDWILDMGLFSGFALWWAAAGVGALALSQNVSPLNALSLLLLGVSVALLTHSLSFLLSALGSPRTSDPVAFLAFLSVFVPVLSVEAPGWLASLAHWAIPPFHGTMVLSGAIRGGEVVEAAGALFHVLLYSGGSLGAGCWRISRWRPLS